MEQTLLDWLIKRYPTAKRQNLKRMVEAGRVTINGRRAKLLKHPIAAGDKVVADERPASELAGPRTSNLQIVYEDEDILVLDKPVGLLTSTVPDEPRPTLWAMAKEYMELKDPKARVGLIHRLDRDASGILVFSKNDAAFQSLKTQFFKHTVGREYTAIVHGTPNPPKGKIESHLIERADGTVHATRQIAKGQLAISYYEVVETVKNVSRLRVKIETGKKHQIRVHLSSRGWPIVGDKMYGSDKKYVRRLMLAATRLTIQHPRDGKEMTFEIRLPKGFEMPDANATADGQGIKKGPASRAVAQAKHHK